MEEIRLASLPTEGPCASTWCQSRAEVTLDCEEARGAEVSGPTENYEIAEGKEVKRECAL